MFSLDGEIPQEISILLMLASLNLSSNNLCGTTPKGAQFCTFSVSSFQWNKCLCGFPLPPCTRDNGSGNNIQTRWLSHVNEEVPFIALELVQGSDLGE